MRFELQALKDGRPFAVVEHVDRLPEDLSDSKHNWASPHGPLDHAYRLVVEGTPSFTLELNLASGGLFCVAPAVNCIPALVAAKPGLLGATDIDRFTTRNVAAKLGPWP